MTTRKSVLGKGLSALIQAADPGLGNGALEVRELPLDRIVFNPDQPRKTFDADQLRELAESIKQVGVLQPIIVRELTQSEVRAFPRDGDGFANTSRRYVVVAGERRVRAARMAGLATITALTRSYEQNEALKIALLENIQRQDLGPIEEAAAYQHLLDAYGATQEELASMLGKNRSTVANLLRLLSLDENIQALVQDGSLTRGHAKVLLGMPPGPARTRLARLCVSRGLSVRECERRAQMSAAAGTARRRRARRGPATTPESPALRALRERTESRLGAPVSIDRSAAGKGTVVVNFYSDDDLERLLGLMGVETDLG